MLADYKTNKLGRPDETLTSWHYRPEALQAEMLHAHYPCRRCCTRWRSIATCAGACRATSPTATSAACCTCSSAA